MTDFAATRALFDLPENTIYLDGNSLGPLPKSASARLATTVADEWGRLAIGGWNRAGWMNMPRRLGDRIGRLIGAPEGTVVVGDTLSIKVFQAVAAALSLRPERRVILSDTGNFPSDLYMADGLRRLLDRGHEMRVVDPQNVADALDEDVAVLMLTEVDYRTGRRHDMAALTRAAHDVGALAVWDLAHSAGAFPVNVTEAGADFAMGCTYKFLNGGPGAPAFVHVAEQHLSAIQPALAGWLGHAAPFDFDLDYRSGVGIERMRVGTPPVLQMAALDAALDIWEDVDLAVLRKRSLELGDLFMEEVARRCPGVTTVTPHAHENRGSQVCFRHDEGYAVMQALIAQGVVGDFRAPDILRFGITPLYIGEADILGAVDALEAVLTERAWDRPEFFARQAVT